MTILNLTTFTFTFLSAAAVCLLVYIVMQYAIPLQRTVKVWEKMETVIGRDYNDKKHWLLGDVLQVFFCLSLQIVPYYPHIGACACAVYRCRGCASTGYESRTGP